MVSSMLKALIVVSVAAQHAAADHPGSATSDVVQLGEEVCITGFVMDNYCIDRGSFLDNPNAVTLAEPENHSIYCLVEAPPCPKNGYQVLGDACDGEGGDHVVGFRLDNTDAVLAAVRAVGKKGVDGSSPPTCKTCTNEDEDAPTHGWRATIKGTVKELGMDSAENIADAAKGNSMALVAPLLTNIQVLGEDVTCEHPTLPVACRTTAGTDPAPVPVPVPVPVPAPAPTGTDPAPVQAPTPAPTPAQSPDSAACVSAGSMAAVGAGVIAAIAGLA